ncbi:MAG TPA: SDR family NAD(P)-dependent oxidoreductase [Steroidobacteraceae bacterium]|jgi:uncharacterized oxidoreductase
MRIFDNTILITGGSSGIGLEFAAQLIDIGNTVIVTGRHQGTLDAARQKVPGIHTIQSDVSDPVGVARLCASVIEEFPKLNVLINNAGIMRKFDLLASPLELRDVIHEIEINLNGTVAMVVQLLPHLDTKDQAAIVNVSSGLAFVPLAIAPIYCASKAAIHSFTQSLRLQLTDTRITIFELVPPLTDTPLLKRDFGANDPVSVKKMDVKDMVRRAIEGLKKDQVEIRPGLSNALKIMSRLAPDFILKQLNRRALKLARR